MHVAAAEAENLPSRLPGLIAQFETPTGQTVRRVDLLLQHQWQNLRDLDERLDGSAHVKIDWQGALEAKADGRYQLHVFVAGKFRLSLNGEAIAEGESADGAWFASREIELPFGYYALALEYSGPARGKLGLYWQGPGFQLEPISERYLSHASSETASDDFERGRLLARALRCAACHAADSLPKPIAAPALTRLDGNLDRQWLQAWLTSAKGEDVEEGEDELADDRIDRRMPHFALTQSDAADIVTALWDKSLKAEAKDKSKGDTNKGRAPAKSSSSASNKSKDKKPARSRPDAAEGRIAVLTHGCAACHTLEALDVGAIDLDDDATYLPHNRLAQLTRALFDGGDLSAVADKRPAGFFESWLKDPQQINSQHRMPVPDLTDLQRRDIALYLATLKGRSQDVGASASKSAGKGDAQRGRRLLAEHRCGACHELPAALAAEPAAAAARLTANSHWDSGCLGKPNASKRLPGFGLTPGQRRALKVYWESVASRDSQDGRPEVAASLLLAERNCTACHARGAQQGLGPRATQIAELETDLAARLPALLPPSLTGVGDKLHEQALQAAVERREEPRRPWLEIRMPKYRLSTDERSRLTGHLIARDRIPDRPAHSAPLPDDVVTRAAAGRLLTSEGFGCQSCHQIGNQQPPTVALNARGTDLTMLGDRIRHSWFDRWVRNPVRIVPRMEMPAIQLPVHGVLGDDLGRQIDAVWEMLNTKGFQPPAPAPVRVVRGHNLRGKAEAAHVLTDVLETSSQNYLRPLIIGLDNRHNLLFDLEKAELAQWWIGDTARELTRGKSWYWEIGGQPIAQKFETLARLRLRDGQDRLWRPTADEQFATELDALQHTAAGVKWQGRVTFGLESQRHVVPLEISLEPLNRPGELVDGASGMALKLTASVPDDFALVLELDPLAGELSPSQNRSAWNTQLDERSKMILASLEGDARASTGSSWTLRPAGRGQPVRLSMELVTQWTVDWFGDAATTATNTDSATTSNAASSATGNTPTGSAAAQSGPDRAPIKIEVVPGFEGVQLPLPRDEMPTALAWHHGDLIIGSLKGRVCRASDADGDGLEETWQPLSDDFPSPYGLASHGDDIDVLVKFGLVRLSKPTVPDVPWSARVVADGWGYTADYHDWAVGLPQDESGNYFVALPCQQDDRTPSAARLRGTIQKLIPQSPTSQNPRAYRLETFAAGQRFPMGLALSNQGELFSTDNQGNYNPFNELNHLMPGRRYGFINKLEVKPGFNPPLESPAVNLPHPWTRSVNGICFLKSPPGTGSSPIFGPYEGHLIGCEYNGLSLIRMSLDVVDGVYQGAAYLFSRPPENGEATFEGPVVCEVSPRGDLVVGNIHDSGWGGGQNTGSVVRLRASGRWPLGIATVRAAKQGLDIQFTAPVDAAAAANPANYTLRSYRRTSTPAYGGADQDERDEPVQEARVAGDGSRVELRLNALREGCVYELRVGAIGADGEKMFPSEAHYTMKKVPR